MWRCKDNNYLMQMAWIGKRKEKIIQGNNLCVFFSAQQNFQALDKPRNCDYEQCTYDRSKVHYIRHLHASFTTQPRFLLSKILFNINLVNLTLVECVLLTN